MHDDLELRLLKEISDLRATGAYKRLETLCSPQGPHVVIEGRGDVQVLCSNDYLGLAADPDVIRAGIEGLRRYGAGTASVRFVAGTFEPHLELEQALAGLVGTQAALTYSSAWSANEAVIGTLADSQTVILSDELNHASIIDAIRLSDTQRTIVYPHNDLDALRQGLEECQTVHQKIVVTDGVFSMEGDIAPLSEMVELSRRYEAVLIVDDSHGTGVLGATGRGTAEHCNVIGDVDVITGTLGKALGGAAGGFVASSTTICDYLVQRSRPHIFSNPISPSVACSARKAVDIVRNTPERVRRLHDNVTYFRNGLIKAGFHPLASPSAIIPIVLADEALTEQFSARLLSEGILVTAFRFPVVPRGQARVRVQMSAALTHDDLDRALAAFEKIGRELGLTLTRS